MKAYWNNLLRISLTITGLTLASSALQAEESPSTAAVAVRMTVTASVAGDKRMPAINRKDVLVKQGKQRLQVLDWVPAQGDSAGLDLFVLIDEASDPRLGSHLDELRKFVNDQPATTAVGIGYMRNATVQVAQDLTTDHGKAAQALRLPIGTAGAYGSPYLSVIDLMKRWPDDQNRREVVMVTDGIERMQRHSGALRGLHIDPNVESASRVAQRTGTMIHTIYAPGTYRFHHRYWEAMSGQLGIAKISDATGGESFYLGLQSPVSLKPYLDDLQNALENQYLLKFSAKPGKKPGLQYVSLTTEVAGVDLSTHDAVWVPAGK